ncbi:MAG TPA: AMP-binding protein [Beutenbergiaceae bacterium]|nr:AMP-binding protein [Beutenbergiaceae bacterium]
MSTAGSMATLARALAEALDGGAPVRLDEVAGQQLLPAPPGTALVVRTSGSTTGTGRPVALSAAALRHSAHATHDHLGGPGQWLLALPPTHIAGVQVLLRSILAGTEAALVPAGGFDPAAVATAISGMRTDQRRYLSLVPTQLRRMLRSGPAAIDALRSLDGVLLGGAATSPPLLAEAAGAGVAVVAGYGMTETCGGCVYDGEPLAGVRIRIDEHGRILLGGPVLATGYLDAGDDPFHTVAGQRWLRTPDAGRIEQGRLQVLGRMDDVVVTGGVNVHPGPTQEALGRLAAVAQVAVVGLPDAEWGQVLTAVVVPAPGGERVDLGRLRTEVGGGPSAPRVLVLADALPMRGPGKVDRVGVRALAQEAIDAGRAERHRG